MNCWNRVVQTLATSGKPVLYADFQFGGSGGFLVIPQLSSATRRQRRVRRLLKDQDLVAAVKCFQVVKQGGTVSEFVAATAHLRQKATPGAGRLAASRTRSPAFRRTSVSADSKRRRSSPCATKTPARPTRLWR